MLLYSSAGTGESKLYKLIHAHHALSNDTTVADDMYVGECQDANKFNKNLIKGNLLMCSYSIRFVLGLSTIKRASETAKNLSAAGVVFYMDPYVIGFQLNPVPMKMPGIILASTNDSKVLCYPFTLSVLYGLGYLGNLEGKDCVLGHNICLKYEIKISIK